METRIVKQRFVAIFCLVLSLIVIGSMAGTAYAFAGVQGQVVDANGDPWVHGGNVTIMEQGESVPVASGALEVDGSFSIPYSGATDSAMMYLLIDYNDGGNGDPNTVVRMYSESPGSGFYDAGTISTGTGPLAITLQDISATGPATFVPVILTGIALIFFAGISVLMVRRTYARVER